MAAYQRIGTYWHMLKALKSYHRDFNEQRQTFLPHPVHDWASHGAGAFRTGAVTLRDGKLNHQPPRARILRGGSFMSK